MSIVQCLEIIASPTVIVKYHSLALKTYLSDRLVSTALITLPPHNCILRDTLVLDTLNLFLESINEFDDFADVPKVHILPAQPRSPITRQQYIPAH